jgi:hypothetical protein
MSLNLRLDNLWRDVVKLRAGKKCERCGRTEELHSHHIFERTNFPTRWDLDNGICLCALCHSIAHKYDDVFKLWVKKIRPVALMEKRKNSQEKIDLYITKAYLEGAKYAYKNQPKLP